MEADTSTPRGGICPTCGCRASHWGHNYKECIDALKKEVEKWRKDSCKQNDALSVELARRKRLEDELLVCSRCRRPDK